MKTIFLYMLTAVVQAVSMRWMTINAFAAMSSGMSEGLALLLSCCFIALVAVGMSFVYRRANVDCMQAYFFIHMATTSAVTGYVLTRDADDFVIALFVSGLVGMLSSMPILPVVFWYDGKAARRVREG